MSGGEATVQAHYDKKNLAARIEAALLGVGKSLDGLTIEDLAPIDQYHSGGLATTKALAAKAGFEPSHRVLDVGSGVGGPARYLATTFGCHVTGVDLSPVHCEVAALMSHWVGLQDKTAFRQGSALSLPFPDGAFDRVWTQNVQMNVEDKRSFYGEIARVLAPGGRFAFSDVLQGPGGPAIYPVVWAMDASISFLQAPEALRALLASLGMAEVYWEDSTAHYIAQRRRMLAMPKDDPRTNLSIGVVVGERAEERLSNGALNAEQGRVLLIQSVWEKRR